MTPTDSPTASTEGHTLGSTRLSEEWGQDEDFVRLGSCSSEWLDGNPTAPLQVESSTLPAGQTALPRRLAVDGSDSFSSSRSSASSGPDSLGLMWQHRVSDVTKLAAGAGHRRCRSCDMAACRCQQQLWSSKPAAAGASVAAGSTVQHKGPRHFEAPCITPQQAAGTDGAPPCACLAGQCGLVVSDESQGQCLTTEPRCTTHDMLASLELVSPAPLRAAPKQPQRGWGLLGGGSAASILPALGGSGCYDRLPSLQDVAVTPDCAGSRARGSAAAHRPPVSKWIGTWQHVHLDQSKPDRQSVPGRQQGTLLPHMPQHSSTAPCADSINSGSSSSRSQASRRHYHGGSPAASASVAGSQQQLSDSSSSPVWLSLDGSCGEEAAGEGRSASAAVDVLQAAVSALGAEKEGLAAHLAEVVDIYHSQQQELQDAQQLQAELRVGACAGSKAGRWLNMHAMMRRWLACCRMQSRLLQQSALLMVVSAAEMLILTTHWQCW